MTKEEYSKQKASVKLYEDIIKIEGEIANARGGIYVIKFGVSYAGEFECDPDFKSEFIDAYVSFLKRKIEKLNKKIEELK